MKKVLIVLLLCAFVLLLSSCENANVIIDPISNATTSDTKAYIFIGNEEKVVYVSRWSGSYASIRIIDIEGREYFTSLNNVIIEKEPSK